MRSVRHAIRQLARSPGFTAVAVLTLALGLGLNAAMFNIVNSLVLHPVGFPDADQLFRLTNADPGQQFFGHRPAHFLQLRREGADFARFACDRPWSFTLAAPGQPAEVIAGLRASAGFFQVLGAPLELGREFLPEEDAPGRNRVVILSDQFWRTRFGADPQVIGRKLRVDGEVNEIIGVAPATAGDLRVFAGAQIYRPLALTSEEIADRVDHGYDVFGRCAPGITPAQAAARLAALSRSLAASDPKEYAGRTLHRLSLLPNLQGTSADIILLLIALSGFVLLIACANLGNLLLARAVGQMREFAIRGALGASRFQLIRPVVAECGVLAVAGGSLGVLVCVWANDWMAREFSSGGSSLVFFVDWRLLFFAFAAAMLTPFVFGVAPALLVSRLRINETLQSAGRSATGDRSHQRWRRILIAAQFALALVLVSGAVFFVRGIGQLTRRQAGWDPAPVLRGILSLPGSRYPDTAHMMRFFERVQERVATLPGVTAAAISYELPAFGFPTGRGFLIEGQPPPKPDQVPGAPINGITPGYFAALGTRVLRGRDFTRQDRSDAPRVIILSETMARTFFPGQEAVGRRLAYYDENVPVWMEVVGVVPDVRFLNVGPSFPPVQAYIPLAQATWSYVALSVRTSVPPATMMDSVRRAVGEIDPDMAVKELMPVTAFIRSGMQTFESINQLLIAFASLGLFLAALGIYGVTARLVTQHTHEIGIRMALGAQIGQVERLIVGAGLRLAAAGIFAGVLGAIALLAYLRSAMPGLDAGGASGIGIAALVLGATGLLACYLPARRATRIDPMAALRAD